jgi:glycosyltransferase involved in cell wall biosynthesis
MNLAKRWLTRIDLGRTEKYENHLLQQFSQTCVTSKIDQQALIELCDQGKCRAQINLLQNGVDLEYFSPGTFELRKNKTLVVSGKMSYHPNINMVLNLVKNIMPIIWKQDPNVKLQIVGKDPGRKILALSENSAIEVTGTVDDIRPYLKNATIALTPITYGVGIQNKVLEAMACNTPVVSTSQAVSALDVSAGEDILVADDPIDYANLVIGLLQNPNRREKVGLAGRNYVENNHNWLHITEKLEEIYLRAEF